MTRRMTKVIVISACLGGQWVQGVGRFHIQEEASGGVGDCFGFRDGLLALVEFVQEVASGGSHVLGVAVEIAVFGSCLSLSQELRWSCILVEQFGFSVPLWLGSTGSISVLKSAQTLSKLAEII